MNFGNASNAFKKLNPALFAGDPGALQHRPAAAEPEPALRRVAALQDAGEGGIRRGGGPGLGRVAGRLTRGRLSVGLVVFRHRAVDDDNLAAGLKHVRDRIARRLGIDDGDQRVSWRYALVVWPGAESVEVFIEGEGLQE